MIIGSGLGILVRECRAVPCFSLQRSGEYGGCYLVATGFEKEQVKSGADLIF